MQNIVIVFAAVSALAATAFTVVAVLWLRKLRATVSGTLSDMSGQQLRATQRLGESVAHVQKQQRLCEQQLQNLAQANIRLRQELATVAHRLENGNEMPGDRTVH